MSVHSVRLEIGFGVEMWITARKARELLKRDAVAIVTKQPLVLRLKEKVTRWSARSDNFIMSGAAFESLPPRV